MLDMYVSIYEQERKMAAIALYVATVHGIHSSEQNTEYLIAVTNRIIEGQK
jgi:hypothetical protein